MAVTEPEADGTVDATADAGLPVGVDRLAAYRGRPAVAPVVVPPLEDGPAADRVHAGQGVLDLPGVPAPRVPSPGVPAHDVGAAGNGATDGQPELRVAAVEPVPATDAQQVMLLRPRVEERVIRRLRLGPVFRMAFGLLLSAYIVILGAGVVLWYAADQLDMITGVEGFVEDLGFENFEFHPDAMLRAAAIGGAILVVAGTVLAVLVAEVFNLLTVVTGGLRAVVGPPLPKRRRLRRWRERRRARRS